MWGEAAFQHQSLVIQTKQEGGQTMEFNIVIWAGVEMFNMYELPFPSIPPPMFSCSISRFLWNLKCSQVRLMWVCVREKSLLSFPRPLLWSVLSRVLLGQIRLAQLKFPPFILLAPCFHQLCVPSPPLRSKPSPGPCGLLSFFYFPALISSVSKVPKHPSSLTLSLFLHLLSPLSSSSVSSVLHSCTKPSFYVFFCVSSSWSPLAVLHFESYSSLLKVALMSLFLANGVKNNQ